MMVPRENSGQSEQASNFAQSAACRACNFSSGSAVSVPGPLGSASVTFPFRSTLMITTTFPSFLVVLGEQGFTKFFLPTPKFVPPDPVPVPVPPVLPVLPVFPPPVEPKLGPLPLGSPSIPLVPGLFPELPLEFAFCKAFCQEE